MLFLLRCSTFAFLRFRRAPPFLFFLGGALILQDEPVILLRAFSGETCSRMFFDDLFLGGEVVNNKADDLFFLVSNKADDFFSG